MAFRPAPLPDGLFYPVQTIHLVLLKDKVVIVTIIFSFAPNILDFVSKTEKAGNARIPEQFNVLLQMLQHSGLNNPASEEPVIVGVYSYVHLKTNLMNQGLFISTAL